MKAHQPSCLLFYLENTAWNLKINGEDKGVGVAGFKHSTPFSLLCFSGTKSRSKKKKKKTRVGGLHAKYDAGLQSVVRKNKLTQQDGR